MQVFIFLTCVLCGIASGVIYDVLYIARVFVCGTDKVKYTAKDKIFTCLCDLIYFIAFSAGFVFLSVLFEFYQIRLYMLVGCALGAVIYLKSLHIFIAFLINKVYNKFTKADNPKEKSYGRGKTQQSSGSGGN